MAISGILGNNADNETILFNSQASSQWSYYQSKSIKENIYEVTLDEFRLQIHTLSDSDAYKQKLQAEIDRYVSEIIRYKEEKAQIKQKAENFVTLSERANEIGNVYDLAEGFYQISLILSALTIISKNKKMWSGSILMGAIAIGITVYGYFIFS